MLAFLFIGLLSLKHTKTNAVDYILANRNIPAWLTALSLAATKYSGYMFIGLMGYIYIHGIAAFWIAFGFFVGDVIGFSLAQTRFKSISDKTGALSFSKLVSHWHGQHYRILQLVIGIITLIFLCFYAAAQFNAGAKALHAMFGWSYELGAVLGAILILSYSFAGGLRASIWTDALQAIVMISTLVVLFFSILQHSGGITALTQQLELNSIAGLNQMTKPFGSIEAMLLFALGWIFNGIGTLGQPHIMVRLMALDPNSSINRMGIYYFFWSGLFLTLILLIGLSTRIFIHNPEANFDAELILPHLALMLLTPLAAGIILSGIFAAIMSTADSQILSCSTVLSEDFGIAKTHLSRRLATVFVTIAALIIALNNTSNVFNLAVFAWSALACTLSPLVIIQCLNKKPSQYLSLTSIAVGLLIALVWRSYGLSSAIYECLPGILASLSLLFIGTLLEEKLKKTSNSSS